MADTAREPVGTLAVALQHAERLLAADPRLAEAQAREILAVAPGRPEATCILGAALRLQGRLQEALEVLAPLAAGQPNAASAQLEHGLVLGRLGRTREAVSALRRTTALRPDLPQAWRALADQLVLSGDYAAADEAYARQVMASVNDPKLLEAATALAENRLAVAERLLREFLKAHPTDVAAIRMLAETGTRLGRYEDAEALLERCLELAPGFTAARHNYAVVLYRQSKAAEAVTETERLLAAEPGNPAYRALRAAALGRLGEYGQAIEAYEGLLAEFPDQPKAWLSYGHALKTVGRTDEAIGAYRRAVALQPGMGEAWFSLANLKTFRFSEGDVADMRAAVDRAGLSDEDRLHLHFALGKALEDAGQDDAAFAHYLEGNALRRKSLDYDAAETTRHVERCKAVFTQAFFAERDGSGSPAPGPIFIVGLPRSGSTLVEQILASHSAVEGTMELPDILAIAKRLDGRRRRDDPSAYPEVLRELDPDALKALGEEYLERTRVHRKLGRPFFIDKMPNNFAHLGLIHLILPNAKIVDARREAMACGHSCFKQHFARGQGFTYDLADLGGYYRDYAELMTWFDEVLPPGRVHRVQYERMIADPEGEVRRLLAYCGLPFEAGCLRFYENDRAVRTASSEQVRRPIYADSLESWRKVEARLAPFAQALGRAPTAS